jgi:Cu/Ag efflux protein CusF
MRKITRRTLGAGALALLGAAAFVAAQQSSQAQQPQTVRVRATIERVDGQSLTAKARDGATMKIQLAANAPVNQVVKASLSDIKQGDYVAVTAMPQPDGSQKAVAILIFPEALRGTGEGHRPWDLQPNSTMTNATVASQVKNVDGATLNVTYKGGEKKVVVSPNTEIVSYKKASAADLKPGQKIFVAAAKKLPDGNLEAPNVAFGDYGVWR